MCCAALQVRSVEDVVSVGQTLQVTAAIFHHAPSHHAPSHHAHVIVPAVIVPPHIMPFLRFFDLSINRTVLGSCRCGHPSADPV